MSEWLSMEDPHEETGGDLSYPSGPYSPGFFVGGNGGSPFETCGGTDGRVVTKLGVWKNSSCLQGIQLTYNDGSQSPVYGSVKDDYAQIIFQPGERVVELTLWGNGIGTRTGRIKLTTSGGQTFDHGKDTSGQTAYSAPVGGGLLVGAAGRCGAEIDMLSMVFLTDIKSVSVTNVNYVNPPTGTANGIELALLQSTTYTNKSTTEPMKWRFENSITRTDSRSWSQSATRQYGIAVTVSAGFFDFAKVGTSYTWSMTEERTSTSTVTTEKTLSWSLEGQLDPGQTIHAVATCYVGTVDVDYNATVTVTMKSGETFTYNQAGVISNVFCSQASATAS
jgi:hypothetical protein